MQSDQGKTAANGGVPEERNAVPGAVHSHIARALARGYTDLFYVNMDTGEYVEYHTDDAHGVLAEARRGADFFESCEREAALYVHPEDREAFVRAMKPDFLTGALSGGRVFELVYRRIKGGATFYVQMKVSLMEEDHRFIVVAVMDIDELMTKRLAEDRLREERAVYARIHALTGTFIVIYVVDPETNRYRKFSSAAGAEGDLLPSKSGADFFGRVRKTAADYCHPEDLDRFLAAFTRERVLAEARDGGLFTLDFRVVIGGNPLHAQLKAAMVAEKDGPSLIVGLIDQEAAYRRQENAKEIERQKEVYNQITESLAAQYDTLYYIDLATGTYAEISSTDEYKTLNVPATGNDFFAESRRSIRKYVHPEDQERVLGLYYKDVMLGNLKDRDSFSIDYRLVMAGKVRHIRHTEIMARDGKHILVCVKNIDAEVRARLARRADREKSVTYTQIAERLAAHYDFIYYVDCESTRYTELSTRKKSGELSLRDNGEDFFRTARKNTDRMVFSEDRERIRLFLDRDRLISRLEDRRQLAQDYRMILNGGKTQYMRMSVTYSSDRSHFIICIENREEDVRREQEHLAALSTANEMARRDELTHTKNLTAFHEAEKELQEQIAGGSEPFGLLVCDINGLKLINDTEGHKAGDDYIRASCMMICRTFHHSPVFRIGGDEFAVILRGQDYAGRESLLSALRRRVEENVRMGEGPVVASGMAVYRPYEDRSVEDVFNRADNLMYENKNRLKEEKLLQETHSLKEKASVRTITEERRNMLDSLFRSFDVISEGTYVYLCDMKYDFSRWSKAAVDAYGLPAEYMYGAGDIWENRIHPEDRAAYRKGINDIFAGTASGHDMQYRAMRATGEYDVCTCRGIVIRDQAGEPEYFAGTIRNHGIQGHIDTLTGLRNQYGFFEDLDGCIKRNTEVRIILLGISRFSEINEMYGYQFGNRALQLYARAVFDVTGNTGHSYRIDGTKFAVISNTLTIAEMKDNYNRFRAFLHEDFTVDGRKVLLNLHCGALTVDNFDIDAQTAYTCLNYAYEESKALRKGELVEFRNDMNEQNHRRLEQLHTIRASITRGFEGFHLLYQPVVDAVSERLVGAEALLRWKNDKYGVVPPDQFIPVLEPDPLFPELGEWILREAVLAARQVLERYPGFVMNVNLSYSQLERPDFVDMVLRILDELDYPPERLCLEVTERCRLLDLARLKSVVVRLKSRGVLVALDDFGTGFSSVGIVREIPFDLIKIDRSFVRAIESSDVDRKVIRSIVYLASIYGTQVCVEGIETKGMRDILKNYHVKSLQGYFFAKPLPLELLPDWSRDR